MSGIVDIMIECGRLVRGEPGRRAAREWLVTDGIDDLDKVDADETVRFSLDKVECEIDLSPGFRSSPPI